MSKFDKVVGYEDIKAELMRCYALGQSGSGKIIDG